MTTISQVPGAASGVARVLEDAAERAPGIARQLPAAARDLLGRASVELTTGIPRSTWNGLDEAGALFPGLHPVTQGELQLRFAWNDQRARMLERMHESLAAIRREHPDVRWVAGGGSFFGSSKAVPGDIDLALLDVASPRHSFTRELIVRHNRLDEVTHVYPGRDWSAGVPGRNYVEFFSHERSGAERGMVLLDLDELGIPAGAGARAIA